MKQTLLNKIAGYVAVFALIFGIVGVVAAPSVFAADAFQTGACQGANLDFSGKACDPQTDTNTTQAASKVDTMIKTFINVFSFLVGITAVFMIMIGGFRYITSGGDSSKVTSAKDTILYAIIGLVVVGLAQIIVKFVLSKTK